MSKLSGKKVVLIVSIIFIVGTISFLVWFVNDLKKDQAYTRKVMGEVSNLYNDFGDSIDVFNDIRNNLYLNVFYNIYYDTLAQRDENVKKDFLEYEYSVNNVNDKANNLKKICDMAYYPDKDINLKCRQFKNVYEQVVNAYKSDVDLYNSTIDSYNNSNFSNIKLEKVKTTVNYIDYDNDGKFEGKEDNK